MESFAFPDFYIDFIFPRKSMPTFAAKVDT